MPIDRDTHLGTHGRLRLLVAAALVLILVLTVDASPAAGASRKACRVTNTDSDRTYKRLQQAVKAAKPGARLVVRGICVGTTRIDHDLTIKGTETDGSGQPTLDGNRQGRVVVVLPGATVTLGGLAIQDGRSKRHCGGVLNRGVLTLRDVVVRRSRARWSGGGICNPGTLRLTGATRVKGNTATGSDWGGIWNRNGMLTMDDTSSVTGNTAFAGAGVGNYGTMVMNGSSKVSDNHGNGVVVGGCGASLTMNDSSSISGNVANTHAGGVALTGTLTMNDSSSISGNSLAADKNCAYAAGVEVWTYDSDCTASLTMTGSSVIRDNHAPCSAGGIANGLIGPDGLVYGPGGTLNGVNCAPQTYANVYGNTPDDCRLQ